MIRGLSITVIALTLCAGAAGDISIRVSPDVMGLREVDRAQRTAGLSMQLNAGRLPELYTLDGEIFIDGCLQWLRGKERQPRPAFGRISAPGRSQMALKNEKTTWVSNEVVYECTGGASEGADTLSICISRLSPAAAVQSDSNGLTVFARSNAAELPGFYAVGAGEAVKAGRLEETVDIPEGAKWLLLWNGRNTRPLGAKDNLLLIVPGPGLRRAELAKAGGIDLFFGQGGVKAALLLLDGVGTSPVSETKNWASGGVPGAVVERCRWWAERLGEFPVDASESYEYEGESDRVSVKYDFKYMKLFDGGQRVAPLPPMLALAAKQGFGSGESPAKLDFSGSVVYAGTPTLFGPCAVIEGVSGYTWTLEGLKRYACQTRKEGAAVDEAQAYQKKVAAEVGKIVEAAPLAPWVFYDDSFADDMNRRTLYWGDAGENVYFLAEMTDLLSGGEKETLVKYLADYQQKFPPEQYGRILPTIGARREFYYLEKSFLEVPLPEEERLEKGPSLYSLYGLSRYCSQTGAKLEAARWEKCHGLFGEFLEGRDWATLFWFQGGGGHGPGVAACNQNFAGLVGLIRLARQAGDASVEKLAFGQLANAATLRYGMGKYRQWLYETGAVTMPFDPQWQPVLQARDWTAQLTTYDCTRPIDDIQQIYWLDAYNVRTGTFDPHGWPRVTRPYQLPFMYMTPELGRFLADHLKAECARHVRAAEEFQPDWYISWAEAALGTEHNMDQPCDAYNNFIARAWILGQSPQELRRYIDVPHLAVGDYFYMHKLAEIARAYRGVTWQEIE